MRKVRTLKIVLLIFICFVLSNIMIMMKGSNSRNTGETDNRSVILTWTKYYGSRFSEAGKSMTELGCSSLDHACKFTDDKQSVSRADAILFHWRDTDINQLPKNSRTNDQIWILYNWETPCSSKPLLSSKHNIAFNWTTSYRQDSTLLGPTSTFVKRYNKRDTNYQPNLSSKIKDIAWIVSNCNTLSRREKYVEEMQKYITVDIFGKCGNNKCKSSSVDDCYAQVAQNYRFYLSFENSICKDYISEKLWLALKHDIVPIVFGGANYSQILPPNSFINALQYTPKQLAHYIHELANDPVKYNLYFEWKSTYSLKFISGFAQYICIVCEALNKWRQIGKPRVSYSLPDIMHWYFNDAECKSWRSHSQICKGV